MAMGCQEFSHSEGLDGAMGDRRRQDAGVATVHHLTDGADRTCQAQPCGHRLSQLLRTGGGQVDLDPLVSHLNGKVGDLGDQVPIQSLLHEVRRERDQILLSLTSGQAEGAPSDAIRDAGSLLAPMNVAELRECEGDQVHRVDQAMPNHGHAEVEQA